MEELHCDVRRSASERHWVSGAAQGLCEVWMRVECGEGSVPEGDEGADGCTDKEPNTYTNKCSHPCDV